MFSFKVGNTFYQVPDWQNAELLNQYIGHGSEGWMYVTISTRYDFSLRQATEYYSMTHRMVHGSTIDGLTIKKNYFSDNYSNLTTVGGIGFSDAAQQSFGFAGTVVSFQIYDTYEQGRAWELEKSMMLACPSDCYDLCPSVLGGSTCLIDYHTYSFDFTSRLDRSGLRAKENRQIYIQPGKNVYTMTNHGWVMSSLSDAASSQTINNGHLQAYTVAIWVKVFNQTQNTIKIIALNSTGNEVLRIQNHEGGAFICMSTRFNYDWYAMYDSINRRQKWSLVVCGIKRLLSHSTSSGMHRFGRSLYVRTQGEPNINHFGVQQDKLYNTSSNKWIEGNGNVQLHLFQDSYAVLYVQVWNVALDKHEIDWFFPTTGCTGSCLRCTRGNRGLCPPASCDLSQYMTNLATHSTTEADRTACESCLTPSHWCTSYASATNPSTMQCSIPGDFKVKTSWSTTSCQDDCGDGRNYGQLECDYSKKDKDCDKQCTVKSNIECTYTYAGNDNCYKKSCGDSKINHISNNDCDDGNTVSNDGCSSGCNVESGYECEYVQGKDICTYIGPGQRTSTCGNGDREFGEECDDSGTVQGDGCGSDCRLELGWSCALNAGNEVCTNDCGDGVVQLHEQCDDQNTNTNDGCTKCIISTNEGYKCSGAPSICTKSCGDGLVQTGEDCDDGNTIETDGCFNNCTMQFGYECTWDAVNNKEDCHLACGTGFRSPQYQEQCDDGNQDDTDGCLSNCSFQPTYYCIRDPTNTSEICGKCGNGLIDPGEECDDKGRQNGQGCDKDCKIEPNYGCWYNQAQGKSVCNQIKCQDGLRQGTEQCDDGNGVDGDGCSKLCQIESLWVCQDNNQLGQADTCRLQCQNGIREPHEGCDDGNSVSGDGCGTGCLVEPTWECIDKSAQKVSDHCQKICGNGKRDMGEVCDDGNLVDKDGCYNCQVENGWGCIPYAGAPDKCTYLCANGKRDIGEQCEDGNIQTNDGCDQLCQIEQGWTCNQIVDYFGNPKNDICYRVCGDGQRDTQSGCDDGNQINGDGCNSKCQVELGYVCTGERPDTCQTYCGDGIIIGHPCDDGNTFDHDGCSKICEFEPYFNCHYNTSIPRTECVEVCGDGRHITKQPGWCDDGNNRPGDGCSPTCEVEKGFNCSGGTLTSPDKCGEICGDGLVMGQLECDDGNLDNYDGCNDQCQYETCFECKGGDVNKRDACKKLFINASIEVPSDSNNLIINFDHPMNISDQVLMSTTSFQILAQIKGNYGQYQFTWQAKYLTSKSLQLDIQSGTILEGDETLIINLHHEKYFRGPHGGCIKPKIFQRQLKNSLDGETGRANSIGLAMTSSTGFSILSAGIVFIMTGSSMETIWIFINTLQIINFLPTITPYFPYHVRVMFRYIKFANADFDFMEQIITQLAFTWRIPFPSLDIRYSKFGIESVSIFNNSATVIFTLILSIAIVGTLIGLSFLAIRTPTIHQPLLRLLGYYRYNYFLRFTLESYLDVYFSSSLNSINPSFINIPCIISTLTGFIFTITYSAFPILIIWFIVKYRSSIVCQNPKLRQRWGVLYKESKTSSFLPLWMNAVFILRRSVYVFTIVTLPSYPTCQLALFVFGCFATLSYHVTIMPYHSWILNLACNINEVCLTVISFIVIQYGLQIRDEAMVKVSGWVMIALVAFMMLTNIFLTFGQVCYNTIVKKKLPKLFSKPTTISLPKFKPRERPVYDNTLHSQYNLNISDIASDPTSFMQIPKPEDRVRIGKLVMKSKLPRS